MHTARYGQGEGLPRAIVSKIHLNCEVSRRLFIQFEYMAGSIWRLFSIVDVQRHMQSAQGGVVCGVCNEFQAVGGIVRSRRDILQDLSHQNTSLQARFLLLFNDPKEEPEAEIL